MNTNVRIPGTYPLDLGWRNIRRVVNFDVDHSCITYILRTVIIHRRKILENWAVSRLSSTRMAIINPNPEILVKLIPTSGENWVTARMWVCTCVKTN